MSGYVIRPHTNTDCFELLCSKWGLPVLGHTEKNEPSFAAPVLKEYLELAHLEAKVKKAIELILEYREKHTLLTMFITPYQESQVDGLMHPDYNQAVRTGRMSCRRPNAQQLSKEAKRLIVVPKDEVFWFWDYSQIEFRLITHYCEIESAITAYNEDPTTDYHNFVADMCGISRAPAKNVNFGVAFGAGKPRVLFMLSSTPDIINEMMTVTDKLIKGGKAGESQRKQLFDSLCRERSEQVYATYHGTFPEIKSTYYRAEQAARTRGFVFNIYGRRRHLLPRFAYKGFNAVIQGSAADLFKEALIKTAPRYNKRIREAGVKQFIMVHDDIGFRVPKELAEDTELKTYIETLLCNPSVPIRVPIRADFQISRKAWNEE
jgi:DNA polymerase-1